MFTSNIFDRSVLTVTFVIFGLMAYSFSDAVWTNPPAAAPEGNVSAPINSGTSPQVKQGNFGVNILATATTTGAVWSNRYCDAGGENCFAAPKKSQWVNMPAGSINGGNHIYWAVADAANSPTNICRAAGFEFFLGPCRVSVAGIEIQGSIVANTQTYGVDGWAISCNYGQGAYFFSNQGEILCGH